MALPVSLVKSYKAQLKQLIKRGIAIDSYTNPSLAKFHGDKDGFWESYDFIKFNTWKQECDVILDRILPQNHYLRKSLNNEICSLSSFGNLRNLINLYRTTLGTTISLFSSGILDDLEVQFENFLINDYVNLSDALLTEDVEGKKTKFISSPILAGIALEKGLRTLCQNQNPPLPVTRESPKGRNKALSMDEMITNLAKDEVTEGITSIEAVELRWWASMRNAAAHGNFHLLEQSKVEEMVKGVKRFLEKHVEKKKVVGI